MSIIDTFHPKLRKDHDGVILLYAGRIIIDKTIKAFFNLPEDLGTKIVANYGSDENIKTLQPMYPNVTFVNYDTGEELAQLMANADVVVLPITYQTLVEANLCGTPVATTPTGKAAPFITDFINGVVDDNLEMAVIDACTLERSKVRLYAEAYFQNVS